MSHTRGVRDLTKNAEMHGVEPQPFYHVRYPPLAGFALLARAASENKGKKVKNKN